jgi:hypothetical protein
MGTAYGLSCAGCGYTVDACGGIDAGMMVTVETMTCLDCKRIVEVVRAFHDFRADRSELGRCRRCKGTNLEPWGPGHPPHEDEDVSTLESWGPCPRCGDSMQHAGATIFWD